MARRQTLFESIFAALLGGDDRSKIAKRAKATKKLRRGQRVSYVYNGGQRRPPKRNPQRVDTGTRRLSAADRQALATAKRLSAEFHGQPHVVELSAAERKPLPRFVAAAGALDEFTYVPGGHSKRGLYRYSHESGDRGSGKSKSRNRPLLVVDPLTRRPAIVADKSPMRFSGKQGFVG
ncbi:MAG: hypothetical protein M1343_06950 [Chloroflexi bacterium]|nr:hypothetical protein [Chloroflexota bacterium]MDA8189761.1 hypothetical protein [Dehalococcoidales bacterium]